MKVHIGVATDELYSDSQGLHREVQARRRDNYTVGNGSPQGIKLTAAMADKPVQKTSLKEKLAAFKVKAAGEQKQENHKEKGKEVTM